jgi:ADP-ribose pyrophosphatase
MSNEPTSHHKDVTLAHKKLSDHNELTSAQLGRWDVLKEKVLLDCRIYKVYERHCKHPSGKEGDFYVIHTRNWVHAIPITTDGKIVMVEQYRFSSQKFHIEIPSGVMEVGENPIEAAQRELREETGYGGSNAHLIATACADPALINNTSYFVLIEDCQRVHELEWDHHEEIVTHLIPISEAIQMVMDGKIDHSLTINALFFLQNYSHKKKIS